MAPLHLLIESGRLGRVMAAQLRLPNDINQSFHFPTDQVENITMGKKKETLAVDDSIIALLIDWVATTLVTKKSEIESMSTEKRVIRRWVESSRKFICIWPSRRKGHPVQQDRTSFASVSEAHSSGATRGCCVY